MEKDKKKVVQKDEKEKIEILEVKLSEMENNWKRALADYKNLQNRFSEERTVLLKYSLLTFIRELLPAIDTLKRAQAHLKDQGLQGAISGLENILKKEGLEEISILGKDFDPELSECVDFGEGEEGKVVEVLEPGYKLGDKVVRVAKVKVGKANNIN